LTLLLRYLQMMTSLGLQQLPKNSAIISIQDGGQRSIENIEAVTPQPIARQIIKIDPYKSLAIEVASGWVGGAVGIATTHPLDCIRVVKQYQASISKNNLSYYTLLNQIRDTHGFAGFYRGVIPSTVLRGAALAANRGGYNTAMQFFEGKKVSGTWRIWVVGGFAGFWSGVMDMPIQLLKCRAQVKTGLAKESLNRYFVMLRRIWVYEGLRAFTNGLIPQLICSIFSYAVFYATYDHMVSSGLPVFISGMVAGTLSWPPFLPFDSLRVRMQCQPYNVPFRAVLGEMWRQPVGRWFIGLGATMLRAAPRWGVTMVTIENCNKILKDL